MLLLLTGAGSISAQWSEDPAVNNRVTPSNVNFYEPQILTNEQGTCYFFYLVPTQLSNGQDAFQYRMQIFSPEGLRIYGAAGKIIAAERNITWTKFNDYIVLDNEGNCIVACYDLRDSDPSRYDFNYYIYKVNPNGEMVWGPVALNGGKPDENMTGLSMCATDDGGTALAYTITGAQPTQRITQLERLDSDGHPLWEKPVVVEPGATTQRPVVVNNGKDEVMVLYQDASSQYMVRVYDADGNDAWGESVVLYTGGFSSDKVYPSFNVQHGPEGGVVFSVMDGGWDGRFIYMTREGEYAFSSANVGTSVAGPDYQSTMPSIYYDPDEQVFYAAFSNMALYGQDGHGVNLQKFTTKGQRLWGDDGVSIVPTEGGQQIANVTVRSAGKGRAAVFYHYMGSTAYNDPVSAYMAVVDSEGNVVMEPRAVTTSLNVKNNLTVSPLIGGDHYIISWTEKRSNSTSECIFAQYVYIDGTTVNGISTPRAMAETGDAACYSLSGIRQQQPVKGINIVRQNGTASKVIVK